MKSEELLFAMNGIDDEIISSAYLYSAKNKIVSFRKKFIVAACVCLMIISTGLFGYRQGVFNAIMPNKGTENIQSQIASGIANSFTLKVFAAENTESELKAGSKIPIIIGNTSSCWGFSESDEYDENGDVIYYSVNLPHMECDGDNIKDITFSINKAKLQIVNFVVAEDGNIGAGTCDSYSSYTFSYDEFKNNKILVSIDGFIPKNETSENAIFNPKTMDEYLSQVKDILDGTIITCQVTYNDGSADSIDIIVEAEYMTYEELKDNYGIDYVVNPEDKIRLDGDVAIFYEVK